MPTPPTDARLVGYLHLRDAGVHTREVLEGHIRPFAEREGYELVQLLVGHEGPAGSTGDAERELIERLQAEAVPSVVIVGPARQGWWRCTGFPGFGS